MSRIEEALNLYQQGLTPEEIAERMGIKPKTVKKYLRLAGVKTKIQAESNEVKELKERVWQLEQVIAELREELEELQRELSKLKEEKEMKVNLPKLELAEAVKDTKKKIEVLKKALKLYGEVMILVGEGYYRAKVWWEKKPFEEWRVPLPPYQLEVEKNTNTGEVKTQLRSNYGYEMTVDDRVDSVWRALVKAVQRLPKKIQRNLPKVEDPERVQKLYEELVALLSINNR